MFFGENIDVQVCIFKEIFVYTRTLKYAPNKMRLCNIKFAPGINKVQKGYFWYKNHCQGHKVIRLVSFEKVT